MRKVWNVALYARVSSDKKEQQESIPVQIESLRKWLVDKSKTDEDAVYNLVETYEDAGFSGSNFERDNFIRMKEDIDIGKINMVLTRDLSRFARNYITAGYYLEDYFKANGVRFISVLDNVDTLEEVNDIIPFKNILNEMYIKDCSRRVRDALKQRMLRGSSVASKPPYGYKFEEEYNGNVKTIKLVPTEDETTEVIREIFSLYMKGWGAGRIATYLNKKNIPPPASRLNFPKAKFGMWTNNTIMFILKNPKYGGIMVQQRTKKVSYKLNKCIKTSEDEWIYGCEFKGIIARDTFYEVQRLIKQRSKNYRYKGEVLHPFSSVLKCHECGGSMSYSKKYKGYKCTNSQIGGGRCTSHSIKEDYLTELITDDLRKIINSCYDRKDAYNYAKEMSKVEGNYEKQLSNVEKELKKLDAQFEKIYIDKLNGLINERNFNNLVQSIQHKQELLINQKEELLNIKNNYKDAEQSYISYKDKIDAILSLDEIDRITVESLVDKIIVTENREIGEKSIDIYYRFKVI